VYEEMFPSLRAAAAALYAATFHAPNVQFVLWLIPPPGSYAVADIKSFRAHTITNPFAPLSIIFHGTIRDLAQLAAPLPPSLNLDNFHAIPPPPIQNRP